MDEAPTLAWVAGKMGYSESGISRLLSGSRKATLDTMRTVEQAFGWPIEQQVVAPEWAQEFNKIITERFQQWEQN